MAVALPVLVMVISLGFPVRAVFEDAQLPPLTGQLTDNASVEEDEILLVNTVSEAWVLVITREFATPG